MTASEKNYIRMISISQEEKTLNISRADFALGNKLNLNYMSLIYMISDCIFTMTYYYYRHNRFGIVYYFGPRCFDHTSWLILLARINSN